MKKFEDRQNRMLELFRGTLPEQNTKNWWNDLPEQHKKGIRRGLADIDEGRTTPHEVKDKAIYLAYLQVNRKNIENLK